MKWIWEHEDWPAFEYSDGEHEVLLAHAEQERNALHELLGAAKLAAIDDPSLSIDAMVHNVVASLAIEGESIDQEALRSSVALQVVGEHRLAEVLPTASQRTQEAEALAQLVREATTAMTDDFSETTLHRWHKLVMSVQHVDDDATTGAFRTTPMGVYSGRIDRPKVHFQAPPEEQVAHEMRAFIDWFVESARFGSFGLNPLIRAAIAHLWFLTIHPYEDGNGRLARAITDVALTDHDPVGARYYPMSVELLRERNAYYRQLEATQRGDLAIDGWLRFFLERLIASLQEAQRRTMLPLFRARFWQHFHTLPLKPAQRKVLSRMLAAGDTDFPDGITASQYARVARVDKATATRHLGELAQHGVVERSGRGKNTRYKVASIGDVELPSR